MALTITQCEIPDVLEFRYDVFPDDRGYFTELHNGDVARSQGFERAFVQDNMSMSHRGVLRGLHYQNKPAAQGKLVRCITGSIFDVAVDIRVGSPTYGRYVARELEATSGNALWIPEGFAHGFMALADDTHVMYKCTASWNRDAEVTIRYDDAQIGIEWPFAPTVVSGKDLDAPWLADATNSFTY